MASIKPYCQIALSSVLRLLKKQKAKSKLFSQNVSMQSSYIASQAIYVLPENNVNNSVCQQ